MPPRTYGHFGLNLRRYAPFHLADPPLRRYPGRPRRPPRPHPRLAAQRRRTATDAGRRRRSARSAHKISGRPSRRAMKAERETFEPPASPISSPTRIGGATFEGHISGRHPAPGLFVKLDDTGADGFHSGAHPSAPIIFRYHEDRHALIGARSGETHRPRRSASRCGSSRPRPVAGGRAAISNSSSEGPP